MENFTGVWMPNNGVGYDFILNLFDKGSYFVLSQEKGKFNREWGSYTIQPINTTEEGLIHNQQCQLA